MSNPNSSSNARARARGALRLVPPPVLGKAEIGDLAFEARALIEQCRALIDAHAARALKYVAEVEAWARGGSIPESAQHYAALMDVLNDQRGSCDCGECHCCTAVDRLRAEFWGCIPVFDIAETMLTLAARGADHGDAGYVRECMQNCVSQAMNSAHAEGLISDALDAAVAARAAGVAST